MVKTLAHPPRGEFLREVFKSTGARPAVQSWQWTTSGIQPFCRHQSSAARHMNANLPPLSE